MALDIRINDSQIRPSVEFIVFLDELLKGRKWRNENWFDQISEYLKRPDGSTQQRFDALAGTQIADERVKDAIIRSYQYTMAILLGDLGTIRHFHDRRFCIVAGVPRSGGSYLLKKLYEAIGMDPRAVPAVIAHDGFPKAWPFYLDEGHNQGTDMARYFAEYLVMQHVFFAANGGGAPILIPKKDINVAYHGTFYSKVLGPRTTFLVTIRHPVHSCLSTAEKSGGMPADGRFALRSNIEMFIHRDLQLSGLKSGAILAGGYFDMYLKYWERYHLQLLHSGAAEHGFRFAVCNAEGFGEICREYSGICGRTIAADEFVETKYDDIPNAWLEKSHEVIDRLANIYHSLDHAFPAASLLAATA